jgi:hypothetical protein
VLGQSSIYDSTPSLDSGRSVAVATARFCTGEKKASGSQKFRPQFVCAINKSMNALARHAPHAALLWPSSAIGVWLLLDFGRQFNKSSDCFSTRREVGLAPAPIVYHSQKLFRYPHLKRAILRAFRWAATGPVGADHFCTVCIDTSTSKVYVQCRPVASSELATGPNPSQWRSPWLRLNALLQQSAS